MSLKNRLRTIACCGVLQAATLIGVPMRPEQVADLMRSLNQPKIARTTPKESEKDGARVRRPSRPSRQLHLKISPSSHLPI